MQSSCKFGKHAGKPTNPTKLLTVGRRSRPSHVLPWGDTNIGQFLKIERMSTAVSFTSRQVQPRTDISLGSGIFFQLCSYSTFATGQRETRDFHPPLNTFQVCMQGQGRFYALTSFLLKAWENYRGLCLSPGATQYPRFLLDTSWHSHARHGAEVYGLVLRVWSEFTGHSTTS